MLYNVCKPILTMFLFSLSVQLLDNLAGQKPQLRGLELFMLSASVAAAASGPWILGGKLTEFLAPTAAACKYSFIETLFSKVFAATHAHHTLAFHSNYKMQSLRRLESVQNMLAG